MCPRVVRIFFAVALLVVVYPASTLAGRIAGEMSNLPPNLTDIGGEYIGIQIERSIGLPLRNQPAGLGVIRPTDASGKAFLTYNQLLNDEKIDPDTKRPRVPTTYYNEAENRIYFYGSRYDFTIPSVAAVDAVIRTTSPIGSTRQAINLVFHRDNKIGQSKETQKLSALLVGDTSSQTINVIVPKPEEFPKTTPAVPSCAPACVPSNAYIPVAQPSACRHGLLVRSRR